ncbi:MAG: class I SAM-dependent methyltransferase [Dongiaceae bacterium]
MTDRRSTDDRLYGDVQLVQFYDLENDWSADCDYCSHLAETARSVLDLGCGTGRLAAALAGSRFVTGVDPAAAMLDVARTRPGGDKAHWIEADARNLRLEDRFDLVLLTGHAFQVFLTPGDQQAVLRTIAHHLSPSGHFIFDTRNPAREEWRGWKPAPSERMLEHPDLGPVKAWNDATHDAMTGVVTYETHYEVVGTGQLFSAASKIAFPTKAALAGMSDAAGLVIDNWLGDWQGAPYSAASKEIIPLGRLR